MSAAHSGRDHLGGEVVHLAVRALDRLLSNENAPSASQLARLMIMPLAWSMTARFRRAACIWVTRRSWLGSRTALARVAATYRYPGPDEERGRGMILVDCISTEWGVEDHEVGKAVWFSLTP